VKKVIPKGGGSYNPLSPHCISLCWVSL